MPRYRSISDIVGKRAPAGAVGIGAFSRLLNLGRTPYRIHALAWINDHIEMSFRPEPDMELVFTVSKLQPVQLALFNSRHLTIRSRGRVLHPDLTRLLVKRFSGRWQNLTLEHMADLLLKDPEFGKLGLPMPPAGDQFNKPESQLDTWGGHNVFASFWAKGELERSQLDSIDFFQNSINVQNSDLECNNVKPNDGASTVQLINFPWIPRIRSASIPQRHSDDFAPSTEGGDDPGMLSTDLTDHDVIMGSLDKVRGLLDHLARRQPRKMVFFSNTCVPTMTGEDIESLVKQYQDKFNVPLTYLTVTPQSMTNVFRDLLVHRRIRAEESVQETLPNAINLIGFQRDAALDEIARLLSDLDLHINTTLLPHLRYEAIDQLPRAALNVLLPNTLWQHLYDQLLIRSRMRYVSPEAPYGPLRTRAWMEAILRACTPPRDLDEIWKRHWLPLRDRWDGLVKKALAYRLGLCARADELHYLLDPAHTWGIPIIGVLEEMGFGLDIMIQMDSGSDRDKAFSILRERFAEPERHSLESFTDFDSMRLLLRRCKSHALFSNHFLDWRITEAGKSQFSLQYFEKGLPGAIRTLNRLLEVCKTSFYRRYSDYLVRTPAGLFRRPEATGTDRGKGRTE